MPRITPVHWRKLVKIFEGIGYTLDRQEGDHLIFVKVGTTRPIVIPMYKDVPVFIILNNIKSAEISRKDFLKLLRRRH